MEMENNLVNKIKRVINSCVTFKQLNSALEYITLYAKQYGINSIYNNAILEWRKKLYSIGGNALRNSSDYMDYAKMELMCGRVDVANEFIKYAEKESKKIEL